MDVTSAEEIIELGDSGVRLLSERDRPSSARVLCRLVSEVARVPQNDVEIVADCPDCGAHHGPPTVRYPSTPSGGAWRVDSARQRGLAVAVASLRHPVGIAVEDSLESMLPEIEAAAFHPLELDALDALAPDRRQLVRATLWARKTALLRAIGHNGLLEPGQLALSMPGTADRIGRVVRPAPELDESARAAQFHDLAFGRVVGSVAVLV